MEDWEDEPVEQLLTKAEPGSSWDDEDLDDNDVKESWEDEDEPEPAPAPVNAVEKHSKKAGSKDNAKKGKVEVSIEAEASLDPVAEKLRQQRLVEEADYKSTTELFAKKGDNKTLDNFIPKSESDFSDYAELISFKLRPYEKSFHYMGLLKAVMRLSMTSLKAADAKDVASSVTAIANEKLKAEKEANAGKKKAGAKKKQLHVDKPDDDVAIAAFDDADEYDFMMAADLESPFYAREKLLQKQKYYQAIHKHTYLKGPMDKITSVAIPLAFAGASLFMIGKGIYNMSHGIGKKE